MKLETAANLIRSGGVVAFPTETVYGLGADAWNPDAVRQIFELKGRPSDNPLIVHLADPSGADDFASDIHPDARKLMKTYWPGPLTLVVQKKPGVPDIVSGGLPTVAIRIPDHPVARQLILQSGPLVAPSANRSGRPSPTRPAHVREDFGDDLPILDGGPTAIGLESTVIDVTAAPFRLLRPGAITPGRIQSDTGIEVLPDRPDKISESPRSPGVRYTHYTPEASVEWLSDNGPDSNQSVLPKENVLLLTHTEKHPEYPFQIHFHGDFDRFARELYDRFRSADHRSLPSILIEPLPLDSSHPIIPALRNRIEKAIGR
ncbi:MAG: L-threonylcarbamoyladenylate synthase [Balneolaceae bacterium]